MYQAVRQDTLVEVKEKVFHCLELQRYCDYIIDKKIFT